MSEVKVLQPGRATLAHGEGSLDIKTGVIKTGVRGDEALLAATL